MLLQLISRLKLIIILLFYHIYSRFPSLLARPSGGLNRMTQTSISESSELLIPVAVQAEAVALSYFPLKLGKVSRWVTDESNVFFPALCVSVALHLPKNEGQLPIKICNSFPWLLVMAQVTQSDWIAALVQWDTHCAPCGSILPLGNGISRLWFHRTQSCGTGQQQFPK